MSQANAGTFCERIAHSLRVQDSVGPYTRKQFEI